MNIKWLVQQKFLTNVRLFIFLVPGMYQGDILLTPEQREKLNRDPNSFGSIVGRRWPGGKIAYQIASNLGE